MSIVRLALAQINTTVGDLQGNVAKVKAYLERARAVQANIVLFPELTLAGYPPEDLLLKPGFAAANRQALESLLPETHGLTAVVGFVDRQDDIFNAAAVLHDGALVGIYHKSLLPNYAVFDEDRYFARGDSPFLFNLPTPTGDRPICFGVSVCEDIWYPAGPPEAQAARGADLLRVRRRHGRALNHARPRRRRSAPGCRPQGSRRRRAPARSAAAPASRAR